MRLSLCSTSIASYKYLLLSKWNVIGVDTNSFMYVAGYMGECGIRGGYGEIINMDPKVMAILLKSISAMLCPTVLGQVVMDVVVNPPKPNEPSYKLFQKEKEETLRSLAERSQLVVDTLNSIPGFKVLSKNLL